MLRRQTASVAAVTATAETDATVTAATATVEFRLALFANEIDFRNNFNSSKIQRRSRIKRVLIYSIIQSK